MIKKAKELADEIFDCHYSKDTKAIVTRDRLAIVKRLTEIEMGRDYREGDTISLACARLIREIKDAGD